MKQRLKVLQSKLNMATARHTVPRPRLTRIIREITRKKLALVVAGAGYGKTSLVAQSLVEIEADSVWYALDESDRDMTAYVSGRGGRLRASDLDSHLSDVAQNRGV